MEKIPINYLKDGYPYIEIEGSKHKHKFMIDTGSPENIINKKALRDFKTKNTIYVQTVLLLGDLQEIRYKIVKFILKDFEMNIPMLVTETKICNGEIHAILGMDFLKFFKASIDLKNKYITLNE